MDVGQARRDRAQHRKAVKSSATKHSAVSSATQVPQRPMQFPGRPWHGRGDDNAVTYHKQNDHIQLAVTRPRGFVSVKDQRASRRLPTWRDG